MRLEDAKTRPVKKVDSEKRLRVSTYTEDYRGEYYNISVEKLIPFHSQARRFFDQESLESLALTIKEHGIRQPLTVLPVEEKSGYYEIVSGERRYRAAMLADLKVVPCIILHDRKKAEEIAIIENVQREDLHPIELMKAYSNLLDKEICASMQEVATKLGIAKSKVVETLSLKNLTTEVQDILIHNRIVNRDFLRVLSKTPVDQQKELLEDYIQQRVKKKPVKDEKIKIMSMSLSDHSVHISLAKTRKLSPEQRRHLISLLKRLIEGL